MPEQAEPQPLAQAEAQPEPVEVIEAAPEVIEEPDLFALAEGEAAEIDPQILAFAGPTPEPEPEFEDVEHDPDAPASSSLFVDPDNAPAKTSCKAVAVLGDSTSTGTMKEYYVRDPNKRLDAQYARIGVREAQLELFGGRSLIEHRPQNENGLMVAQRLRDAGFKGCWVIALGTNDAANVAKGSNVDRVERIEQMMAIIGGEPVLWVDAATNTQEGWWAAEHMRVWNDDLAATLQRYPNARIYRWSEDIDDEWYVSDGIHYNRKGYTARAKLLAEALAAAFPAA